MITVYVHDVNGGVPDRRGGKQRLMVTVVDDRDGAIHRGEVKRDYGRRYDWRHTLRVIAASRAVKSRAMRRRLDRIVRAA